MALEISYSPQFFDSLESILNFFDERNGSDAFSKKVLKMIYKQIKLVSSMPEIGRMTDFPGVRILFIERFGIEYQIRDKVILIIDIYSCQTDSESRAFKKQWIKAGLQNRFGFAIAARPKQLFYQIREMVSPESLTNQRTVPRSTCLP